MHSLLQAVEQEPQPESVKEAWVQGIAFYFHVRMVRFPLKRPDLYIGSSFKICPGQASASIVAAEVQIV